MSSVVPLTGGISALAYSSRLLAQQCRTSAAFQPHTEPFSRTSGYLAIVQIPPGHDSRELLELVL
jgi:hypothetical protein